MLVVSETTSTKLSSNYISLVWRAASGWVGGFWRTRLSFIAERVRRSRPLGINWYYILNKWLRPVVAPFRWENVSILQIKRLARKSALKQALAIMRAFLFRNVLRPQFIFPAKLFPFRPVYIFIYRFIIFHISLLKFVIFFPIRVSSVLCTRVFNGRDLGYYSAIYLSVFMCFFFPRRTLARFANGVTRSMLCCRNVRFFFYFFARKF